MELDFTLIVALAFVGILIFFLSRSTGRYSRYFRQAGFNAVPIEGSELVRVAEVMTGLPAVEIHSGSHKDRDLTVVELDSGSSDDPNLTLVLYELRHEDFPAAAAFQTSARLPTLLRRVTGGFFAQLDPLQDAEHIELAKGREGDRKITRVRSSAIRNSEAGE